MSQVDAYIYFLLRSAQYSKNQKDPEAHAVIFSLGGPLFVFSFVWTE